MPESPCPGRCNTGFRKARDAWLEAVAAYDPLDPAQSRPAKPEIVATLGDPWCGSCQATIRRELSELGTLASHLSGGADGYQAAGFGDRISGTPGRRSPSPDFDVFDELFSVLYGWECAWWETRFHRPGPPDRRGYLADRLTDTVLWLLDHFTGMICHPDIARPLGEEIRDWHRTLCNRTKTGTKVRPMPLRCPGHGCGELSLTWREGDEYVRCGSRTCGRMMTRAEYDAYAAAFAGLPVAS
jgi:hypothetical protein